MNLDKKYEENLYNDNLYKEGAILQVKIELVKKVLLLLFIILLICDAIFVFTSYPGEGSGYNSDKIMMIQIGVFVIFGLISILIFCCLKRTRNNHIKKYLILKYGDINYSTKKIKKMTSGNVFTEGSTRNKYNCLIEIPKYNCSIRRYEEQILKGRIVDYHNEKGRNIFYRFTFETLNNFVEYRYHFSNIEKFSSILKAKIANTEIIGDEIIVKIEVLEERSLTICNELEIINKAEIIYHKIKNIVEEVNKNEY